MVMGRNGHGPKWLWAEMTSDPDNQETLLINNYPKLHMIANYLSVTEQLTFDKSVGELSHRVSVSCLNICR